MPALILVLLGALSVAGTEPSPGLVRLLEQTPAESLLAPLRRYEHQQLRGTTAAEAAFVLGQLHLVRGEYRLAADAFSRAAAGFEPARKEEALHWAGIAWLGVPDPHRARGPPQVVERGGGGSRAPRAWSGTRASRPITPMPSCSSASATSTRCSSTMRSRGRACSA